MTSLDAMLRDIDEEMFEPTRWKAINVNNEYVRGLRAGNMAQAMAWIGEGQVATVFGRLGEGYSCLDVDVDGDLGEALTEHVASWCESHDIWCLVRPSGGARGRHHIFMRLEKGQGGLGGVIYELTEQHSLGTKALDWRLEIRPLSAPHRTGSNPKPYGGRDGIREAWRTQPRTAEGRAARPRYEQPKRSKAQAMDGSGALLSPARICRPLPREWEDYLDAGTLVALGSHSSIEECSLSVSCRGGDHSRTTYEAIATKRLVAAGYTADEAWIRICNAPAGAMDRASSDRRRWTRWVWNKAVRDYAQILEVDLVVDDDSRPPSNPAATSTGTPATPLENDVAAARQALNELLWTVSPRRRDALHRVGTEILDRITRTANRRIPVPERDLVTDTGLSSRRAIREALQALDGLLGDLHRDCLDHSDRESTSFEFSLRKGPEWGLSQKYPPSSHTPQPSPPPPGTWAALPRPAARVWANLPHTGAQVEEICTAAALTGTKGTPVTLATRRSALAVLLALAAAGLAECDAQGNWSRRSRVTEQHRDRARVAHNGLARQVQAERQAYRALKTMSWKAQQRRAIAQDHDRYQRWWSTLDSSERDDRVEQWKSKFEQLALVDQERLKHEMASKRNRAGINESDRHQNWIESMPSDELARRIVERTRRFQLLPGPLKFASVNSWERHRGRHQVPRMTERPVQTIPRNRAEGGERDPQMLFDLSASA